MFPIVVIGKSLSGKVAFGENVTAPIWLLDCKDFCFFILWGQWGITKEMNASPSPSATAASEEIQNNLWPKL
jgi:hypothetical protein